MVFSSIFSMLFSVCLSAGMAKITRLGEKDPKIWDPRIFQVIECMQFT